MRTVREYMREPEGRVRRVELGCGMIYRKIPNGGVEFYLGLKNGKDPDSDGKWSFFCGYRTSDDPNIIATARRAARVDTGIHNILMEEVVGTYFTSNLPNLVKTVVAVGRYSGEPCATREVFSEGGWLSVKQIRELRGEEVTFGTKRAIRDFLMKRGFVQD